MICVYASYVNLLRLPKTLKAMMTEQMTMYKPKLRVTTAHYGGKEVAKGICY